MRIAIEKRMSEITRSSEVERVAATALSIMPGLFLWFQFYGYILHIYVRK